jgi:hypothetical protein
MSNNLSNIINDVFRNISPSDRAKLFNQLNAARGGNEKFDTIAASHERSQTLVQVHAAGEVRRLGLRVDDKGHVDELDFRAKTAGMWPERRMAVRGLLCQAGYLPL